MNIHAHNYNIGLCTPKILTKKNCKGKNRTLNSLQILLLNGPLHFKEENRQESNTIDAMTLNMKAISTFGSYGAIESICGLSL